MFEKVNPSYSDKVADRIAGAIVDLAYEREADPKIAVEVLIGHGIVTVIIESDLQFNKKQVNSIIKRIAGTKFKLNLKSIPQDVKLAKNQGIEIKCGDNGIFKGIPVLKEETKLSAFVHSIYEIMPTDGKFITNGNKLITCQSNCKDTEFLSLAKEYYKDIILNPLGNWTGGLDIDSGATNRKLGSDMEQSVTGVVYMEKTCPKQMFQLTFMLF